MKTVLLVALWFIVQPVSSQDLKQKLSAGYQKMMSDPQFIHSIISFYVEDANKGEIIFNKNEQLGLAPASCLKIITSASAFEFLGKNFRAATEFFFKADAKDSTSGVLYIRGSADPTLGSWRFDGTTEKVVLSKLALGLKHVRHFQDFKLVEKSKWDSSIPDGWIWQDVGNYYGAAAHSFNWHENQYELKLKSGENIGDSVKIIEIIPVLPSLKFRSEIKSAERGTGDNAYIYLPVGDDIAIIRGTIPRQESAFSISGSLVDPFKAFKLIMINRLNAKMDATKNNTDAILQDAKLILKHLSPSFDSMNYWFMKKSINLYGEAFVKMIGFHKTGYGFKDSGLAVIRNFWSTKGIDKSAIKIIDGCGLSPGNHVTTQALVKVLAYSRVQKWFDQFYDALPVINGIRMKSGSINGVISYSGYIKSNDRKEYTFSFIVNNFDGSASLARQKIFKFLDLLK